MSGILEVPTFPADLPELGPDCRDALERAAALRRPGEEDAIAPSTACELSNRIVGLYRTIYDRGPSRTRTLVLGNVVVTVLRDVLHPHERRLIAIGADEVVRTARAMLRDASAPAFRESVEQLVGYRAESPLRGLDLRPEVAVEIFVLDPGSGPR